MVSGGKNPKDLKLKAKDQVVVSALPKRHLKRNIALAVVVVAALAVGGYFLYKHYNVPTDVKVSRENALLSQAFQSGNKAQALADAKKVLSYEPNDINAITQVAYLTEEQNPAAAKQYFLQALNELKKQNNPDVAGKSAETYWAAAELAEQAGETSQAKVYYQEVIKAAKPGDSYEETLASQSQAALERLK